MTTGRINQGSRVIALGRRTAPGERARPAVYYWYRTPVRPARDVRPGRRRGSVRAAGEPGGWNEFPARAAPGATDRVRSRFGRPNGRPSVRATTAVCENTAGGASEADDTFGKRRVNNSLLAVTGPSVGSPAACASPRRYATRAVPAVSKNHRGLARDRGTPSALALGRRTDRPTKRPNYRSPAVRVRGEPGRDAKSVVPWLHPGVRRAGDYGRPRRDCSGFEGSYLAER